VVYFLINLHVIRLLVKFSFLVEYTVEEIKINTSILSYYFISTHITPPFFCARRRIEQLHWNTDILMKFYVNIWIWESGCNISSLKTTRTNIRPATCKKFLTAFNASEVHETEPDTKKTERMCYLHIHTTKNINMLVFWQ
jgi:hypothetical protein